MFEFLLQELNSFYYLWVHGTNDFYLTDALSAVGVLLLIPYDIGVLFDLIWYLLLNNLSTDSRNFVRVMTRSYAMLGHNNVTVIWVR